MSQAFKVIYPMVNVSEGGQKKTKVKEKGKKCSVIKSACSKTPAQKEKEVV